jgi:oxygen-dependent protoporphyrinogen oxidase
VSDIRDAIVIGAGISGLTAAYALEQQGLKVTVLDAGERAGGLIQTVQEDGFLMENGPQSFAPGRAPELKALCDALNMDLEPANAHASRRYLYLQSRLVPLPSKPQEAIFSPILSWPGKWRVLQEPWQPPTCDEAPSIDNDISIDDFFRSRFGDEVADRLVNPFVSGIYAGDPRTLSLPSVFPSLWQMQAESGSILKSAFLKFRESRTEQRAEARRNPQPNDTLEPANSKHALFSLKRGLQYLPLTLARQISEVHFGVTVQSISREKATYELTMDDGRKIRTTRLILAVSAYVAAQLLKPVAPLAADALTQIPYVSLAVAHTAFLRSDLQHPLDGFGFLVPEAARMTLLGSIWASSLFPERAMEHYVLLSNYLGGARNPQLAFQSPEEIVDITCRDLTIAFKNATPLKPSFSRVTRHARAIPQYALGHRARMQTVDWDLSKHPNLALCGNYLDGVALNECVKSGMKAAERVFEMG